jgi:hypothetical protein
MSTWYIILFLKRIIEFLVLAVILNIYIYIYFIFCNLAHFKKIILFGWGENLKK